MPSETPTKILRLIIKVPRSSQTGPDSWTDTTHYETFDLPCPAGLESFGESGPWYQAAIVGAEIVAARPASNETPT